MAILEVSGLNKSFGGRRILKDISFSVNEGEIVGLLGPNGAGKTTAIRCVMGLLSIDGGRVTINGFDVVKDFEHALERVGGIIESPELYGYLSGYDNLKLFSRMYTDITDDDISRVVSYVKLDNRIKDKVKKYSLGMRQRIGVAQAMLHNPNLLVLDEPTNGLDPAGVKELRDTLRMLADNGAGVLVSSHLLAEMELMCDRVIIIENGVVNTEKTLSELTEIKEDELYRYHYEVSDPEALKTLLEENSVQYTFRNSTAVIELSKTASAALLKMVIAAEIDVYSVYPQKRTLEEAFLEVTHQGTIL